MIYNITSNPGCYLALISLNIIYHKISPAFTSVTETDRKMPLRYLITVILIIFSDFLCLASVLKSTTNIFVLIRLRYRK